MAGRIDITIKQEPPCLEVLANYQKRQFYCSRQPNAIVTFSFGFTEETFIPLGSTR